MQCASSIIYLKIKWGQLLWFYTRLALYLLRNPYKSLLTGVSDICFRLTQNKLQILPWYFMVFNFRESTMFTTYGVCYWARSRVWNVSQYYANTETRRNTCCRSKGRIERCYWSVTFVGIPRRVVVSERPSGDSVPAIFGKSLIRSSRCTRRPTESVNIHVLV